MSDIDTSDASLQEFPERVITPTVKRSSSKERTKNKDSNMSKKNNSQKGGTPLPQRAQSNTIETMSVVDMITEYTLANTRRQKGDSQTIKSIRSFLENKIKEAGEAESLRDELENLKKRIRQSEADDGSLAQSERLELERKLLEQRQANDRLQDELEEKKEQLRISLLKTEQRRETPEVIVEIIEQHLQLLQTLTKEESKQESTEIIIKIKQGVDRLKQHLADMKNDRDKYKREFDKVREELRMMETQQQHTEKIQQHYAKINKNIDETLGQQGAYIKQALIDLKQEMTTMKRSMKVTTTLAQQQQRPLAQQQRPQQSATSYSTVLQQRPPPKPSIVVVPKDTKTSIQEISAALCKEVGVLEMSKLICRPTKAGNMVLTCRNDEEEEKLRARLTENESLTEKLAFNQIRPRMIKMIIFGVPKDEITDDRKEHHAEELLRAALIKALHIDNVTFKLHKVMTTKKGDAFNIVFELPQREANFLEDSKFSFACSRCTIRRYITTPRCYTCQKLGHMSKDCTGVLTCAKCARQHDTKDCLGDRKRCVNCYDKHRNGSDSDNPINFEHFSFDGCCPSYRKYQSEIFEKQRQQTSKSHSR